MTPCSLIDHHQLFGANCCLFNPEDGDSIILQEVGNDLSKTTAHPRKDYNFFLFQLLFTVALKTYALYIAPP
jgi:hypothetical protein